LLLLEIHPYLVAILPTNLPIQILIVQENYSKHAQGEVTK